MARGKRTPARNTFRANKQRRNAILNEMRECAYCGCREDLTVDHIRPLGKGGTNDRWNLHVLCEFCNNAKGDQYPYRPPSQAVILAEKARRGI